MQDIAASQAGAPSCTSAEERFWRTAAAKGQLYLRWANIAQPRAQALLSATLTQIRRSIAPESAQDASRALLTELRRAIGFGVAAQLAPVVRRIRRQPLPLMRPRLVWRRRRLRPQWPKPRRLTLAAAILGTAGWATIEFTHILGVDGFSPLDAAHIGVFAALALWLSQSFWTLITGLAVVTWARLRPRPLLVPAATGERLALLMPIYNEDSARVFAGIEAIWQDLATSPAAGRIDLYILSDTTDPDLWLIEIERFAQLRARARDSERLFYRRRPVNVGRKTGNIEDFLVRRGHQYGYFLILDADSLMSGATIGHLLALMDADPQLGLVQVPPVLVRARTLFARNLQLATALFGRMAAAGTAFWAMDEGNYWGHNAIIRTAAFMRYCGLPELPGRPPLGGQILSHDFVEAALMRRAGYKVRIAWEVDGSFEEPPATLEQFLRRDRRWCQGNMQHLRVLFARELHLASRLHLAIGVMSYLASPLWLLFLLLAAAQAWLSDRLPLVSFDPALRVAILLPSMVVDMLLLTIFMLSLLFVPRLLALAVALLDQPTRRAFGGGLRLLVSALFETVFSALLAPVMMLFHTGYVISILFGAAVDWRPQRRTVPEGALVDLINHFRWPSLIGLCAAVVALMLDPWLALWLSPVLAGLILALPLAMLSITPRLGDALAARGLLCTPQDLAPAAVVRLTDELLAAATALDATRLLRATLVEPLRLQRHLELLALGGVGPSLAEGAAELLVRKAALLGPEHLEREERLALLASPEVLIRAHVELWAQTPLADLPQPTNEPEPADRLATPLVDAA